MPAMPHAARAARRTCQVALLLAGAAGALGLARARARRRGRRLRSAEKAAEDCHIGFRWLQSEARLAHERDAESVFRAVVRTLARRLGEGEARHLAAHLPLGLRAVWDEEARGIGRPQRFDRDAFVRSVQSRLRLEERDDAELLVSIVFGWLKHLAAEEREDAAALLPDDLRQLWEQAQLPVVPPWRVLTIPVPPPPHPARHVRFLLWEPGEARAHEAEGHLLELPQPGSRFWLRTAACRVQRVEEGMTPVVHLSRDTERERHLKEGVPAGCMLSVHQSDHEEGRWFAEVIAADGHVVGSAHDDDCDAAADAARAQALHALGAQAGYHPEREVE
jgi:uncharacterized protein (DUF2267 family)